MALLSREPIYSASLAEVEKWAFVGSGGFGKVFKARHKDWGFDVAIKLLHQAVGPQSSHSSPFMQEITALNEEAEHMNRVSCEFVLRVYGIYCEPEERGIHMQKGIVMEFMQKGSIETLQRDLSGPPPLPLAFRLAHQVALGMNFLHSKDLIHHDLKPSNVLLNNDLNAKLADFGLSRISTSALNSSHEMSKKIGGSYKYMPPEAFDASYEPVRAFDSYSYGILLWSVFTGEEPYRGKGYSLVELWVTERHVRPPCEKLEQMKVDGMKEIVNLMKRCWDKDPAKRHQFKDCCEVTEDVYLKHERDIPDAVHQVLTRLKGQQESSTKNQNPSTSQGPSHSPPMPAQTKSNDTVDHVRFTKEISVSVPKKNLTVKDKANFVTNNWWKLVQDVEEVLAIVEDLGSMVHGETYSRIKAEPTNQQKMRELHNTLHSGGEKVKAAFYDSLIQHHPHLVESLGG